MMLFEDFSEFMSAGNGAFPEVTTGMRGKIKKIHMVGIGGSGMSGIAEVLLNLGYEVTGSDVAESPVVYRLRDLGARVFIGHAAENIDDAGVVVKSTAIGPDNPELERAAEMGVPIIPRAEMLAELMRLRKGIAVAGTHGKTTTTSLVATVFKEARLDPTVIIGGRLNAFGANAVLGGGEYLIAEADESDGSFLCLLPIITVVTNVDADHLDFYPDFTSIKEAFVEFLNNIPFYGVNVVCGDDPVIRELLPRVKRPVITYGFGPENDLRGEIISCGSQSAFRVYWKGEPWAEAVLSTPGRHNVLNALAAIGVAIESGLSKDAVLKGLAEFGGVGRRFEVKGEMGGVLVVDDYGHHPTEVEAVLETARLCHPDRRLVVAFQPHRFTRTQALFGDFCKVLGKADLLLMTEIYPASEAPIPGVSGQSLAHGVRQVNTNPVEYFPDVDSLVAALPGILKPGDLFLTLGAGNIWQAGVRYLES